MNSMLRLIGVLLYVLALVVGASALVGFSAKHGFLIYAAFPLALIPILGLHYLRSNERLAGWSVFTVWLGSTYAMGGDPAEVMVYGAIVAFAVAGYYRSPWLLVAPWFFHIAWDFMPRELPSQLTDLPTACLIFDGIIGSYLAWMTHKGSLSSSVLVLR